VKRFLFTTLPTNDFGLLSRSLPIARELTAKVRKVLSTPSYKQNAMRIGAKLKEYGGAPRAAELIEQAVRSI
jgi:UDP:flavonoid glycosyltransferase YjiC (YdhE family)